MYANTEESSNIVEVTGRIGNVEDLFVLLEKSSLGVVISFIVPPTEGHDTSTFISNTDENFISTPVLKAAYEQSKTVNLTYNTANLNDQIIPSCGAVMVSAHVHNVENNESVLAEGLYNFIQTDPCNETRECIIADNFCSLSLYGTQCIDEIQVTKMVLSLRVRPMLDELASELFYPRSEGYVRSDEETEESEPKKQKSDSDVQEVEMNN